MSEKKRKRYFREMAALAHERELSGALEDLYFRFGLWKNGKTDCFDLNQEIHEFHNGKSRELYKFYTMGDPMTAVAYAIANGIFNEAEINQKYIENIREIINHFSNEKVY